MTPYISHESDGFGRTWFRECEVVNQCTTVDHTTPHHTTPHHTTPHHTTPHHTTPHHTTPHNARSQQDSHCLVEPINTPQLTTPHHSWPHHTTVDHTTPHPTTTTPHHSWPHHTTPQWCGVVNCGVVWSTVVWCGQLWCINWFNKTVTVLLTYGIPLDEFNKSIRQFPNLHSFLPQVRGSIAVFPHFTF